VAIAVAAVNDPPVANAQSVTTNQDTAKAMTLTASDVDGDPLTYAVVTAPTHGALSGVAPNLTYTPAAGYFGPDSFTFKANDGAVDSAAATVSLTVVHVNHAPVADAQAVTTAEDTAKAIVLTASDADGDPLTYSVVAGPTHGALSGTAPNLTYTPAANYNGPDSFTFKANDGTVDSSAATVSITVTAVNDPPVAANDSYAATEDTVLTIAAPGVLANDSDVDGDPLTALIVVGPGHGSVTLNANGSFTYTPAANYNGPDSFTYKANDGALNSNIATVAITVAAVNDPPVATAQSVTTNQDTAKAMTLTASDVDGDSLTYAVVTAPTHGTLSGVAPNLTYTPAAGYFGPDSFTFKANDGTVDSAAATVSLTVVHVNHAPVATAQTVTTAEDTAKAVVLTATDADGDPLTYSVVAGPTHGALSGTAPNLTYTPAANYNGPDSFTFKANDGTVDSSAATVSITVTAVNDPPPPAQAATLTVTATGRSGERVTSSPAGISVATGSSGSASFATGTAITLTVSNGRDAIWSGACSSGGAKTKSCTFTLTAAATVTANVQ